jgi:hypothetical protein
LFGRKRCQSDTIAARAPADGMNAAETVIAGSLVADTTAAARVSRAVD